MSNRQLSWVGADGVVRTPLRPILAMVAAMAASVGSDAIMAGLTTTLPPGELIALRGLLASGLVCTFVVTSGDMRSWRAGLCPPVILRGVGEAFAVVFLVTALASAPLMSVSAIQQLATVVLLFAGALVLRERVTPRLVVATMVSLIGALAIVKPMPNAVTAGYASAVLAMLCMVFRDIQTRAIPRHVPLVIATFITTMAVTIVGLALSLHEIWVLPSPRTTWALLWSAELNVAGVFLIAIAYRDGAVATVAPFRYSHVLASLLVATGIQGVVPDASAMVGALLIVGAGIAMMSAAKSRDREIKITNEPSSARFKFANASDRPVRHINAAGARL